MIRFRHAPIKFPDETVSDHGKSVTSKICIPIAQKGWSCLDHAKSIDFTCPEILTKSRAERSIFGMAIAVLMI